MKKPTKQEIQEAKEAARATKETAEAAQQRVKEARAIVAELEQQNSKAWTEHWEAERRLKLASLTASQINALASCRDGGRTKGVGPSTLRMLASLGLVATRSGWRGRSYVEGITDKGRALLAERGL